MSSQVLENTTATPNSSTSGLNRITVIDEPAFQFSATTSNELFHPEIESTTATSTDPVTYDVTIGSDFHGKQSASLREPVGDAISERAKKLLNSGKATYRDIHLTNMHRADMTIDAEEIDFKGTSFSSKDGALFVTGEAMITGTISYEGDPKVTSLRGITLPLTARLTDSLEDPA